MVVHQETITSTLSWYKILPPSGLNLIRANQRFHRRRRKVYENSRSSMESLHFNTSSIWDKWYRWEPFDEWKKALQMKDGGRILWNVVAICQMSKLHRGPKDQSNSSGESEASTDPMTTRSAKHACGKSMQTNLDMQASGSRGLAHTEDETDKEDPTRGIQDWFQPFTANLEDLETHVPAHSSEREISDPEGDASKVGTEKRKHSIYTHFSKDRNCDICLRAKITRVPCRRRDKGSIPRAEKFGDLITADHKVLNE